MQTTQNIIMSWNNVPGTFSAEGLEQNKIKICIDDDTILKTG